MLEGIGNHIIMNFEYIIRILLACLCGGALGYERKRRKKEAGIRTHTIVAIGASLIMIISKYGFLDIQATAGYGVDVTRIASNVVTGISFLGAGVIFVKKEVVRGLTTAAGLWTTAGISLAFGAGMYVLGIFCTMLILFIQFIHFRKVGQNEPDEHDILEITFCKSPQNSIEFKFILEELGLHIYDINVTKKLDQTVTIQYNIGYQNVDILWNVSQKLLLDEEILGFRF